MLDINLKSKEKKIRKDYINSSVGILVMIMLLAIISVCSYSPIKTIYQSDQDSVVKYIESTRFTSFIVDMTNDLLYSNQSGNFYSGLESIKYYINNGDNTITKSNMQNISKEDFEKELSKSKFYLRIITDEAGNISKIENSSDVKLKKEDLYRQLFQNNEEKLKYSNLEITYIVPKNIQNYNDSFIDSIRNMELIPLQVIMLIIGMFTIIVLNGIGYILPYSKQTSISICRLYNKSYLEIKLLLWLTYIGSFMGVVAIVINSIVPNLALITDIINKPNLYFYSIGIPLAFVLYILVYLNVVYTKDIYYKGLKEGLVRNSLIGILIIKVVKLVKAFANELMAIDIRENYNKQLIKALAINLLVLWLIRIPVLGFIIGIAYIMYLYKYLTKFFNNASIKGKTNPFQPCKCEMKRC